MCEKPRGEHLLQPTTKNLLIQGKYSAMSCTVKDVAVRKIYFSKQLWTNMGLKKILRVNNIEWVAIDLVLAFNENLNLKIRIMKTLSNPDPGNLTRIWNI